MRARNYARLRRERKEKHWYFMALDKEEVVDASRRGGLTRFLNHSCEPNAECQSWTVDGEKRIAIVAQRPIAADEEVTFDYSWKGDQDKYEEQAVIVKIAIVFAGEEVPRGSWGTRRRRFSCFIGRGGDGCWSKIFSAEAAAGSMCRSVVR